MKQFKICQDVDIAHGYAYPFIYLKKLCWFKIWKFRIPYYDYVENDDGNVKIFNSYDEALTYVNKFINVVLS